MLTWCSPRPRDEPVVSAKPGSCLLWPGNRGRGGGAALIVERTPAYTPGLPIAGEQLPNPQPAQLVKSASPALAANAPPEQSSGGAERRPLKSEVAGSGGQADRDHDQAAVKDPANNANAIPYAWDEQASPKPKEAWWHARAVRVAEAKKRFWRRHLQARVEINRGECFFFVCLPWQTQRIVYQPPRYVNSMRREGAARQRRTGSARRSSPQSPLDQTLQPVSPSALA